MLHRDGLRKSVRRVMRHEMLVHYFFFFIFLMLLLAHNSYNKVPKLHFNGDSVLEGILNLLKDF